MQACRMAKSRPTNQDTDDDPVNNFSAYWPRRGFRLPNESIESIVLSPRLKDQDLKSMQVVNHAFNALSTPLLLSMSSFPYKGLIFLVGSKLPRTRILASTSTASVLTQRESW